MRTISKLWRNAMKYVRKYQTDGWNIYYSDGLCIIKDGQIVYTMARRSVWTNPTNVINAATMKSYTQLYIKEN